MLRRSLCLVFFCLACSDSTGSASRVAGAWTYSATFFSSGNRCDVSGIRLSLTASERTFTGSSTGGSISCIGGPPGGPLQNFTVAAGRVTGDSVAFDLNPLEWRHQGRLLGDSIGGSVLVLAIGNYRDLHRQAPMKKA
jgi:hypothetical protein